MLQTLGMPVAYMKHSQPVALPYLIYRGNGSVNLKADNVVYNSDNNYVVEYYFDKKSEATERQIEQLFYQNDIPWEKSEDVYIQTEDMFVIYYFI